MELDQIGIALFGVTGILLTQTKKEKYTKYACLFGIAAQPFWFYTSVTHKQWGIFLLNFLYAGAWLVGAWNYWIKPWKEARAKPTS